MTTVIIGKKNVPISTMFFHFDSEMAAYGFYADAKDSYAEDNFFCEMVNEYVDELEEEEEEETDYSQYAEPINGWDYNECLDRWE